MSLDIFSKNKDKNEDKLKIIVDWREKNSLVPSFLIKNNCEIEFKQLEIGDYLAGETIIERKTFSDLQSSIIDKRIFSQIENLEKSSNKLLIIEGEKENLRLNSNAVRGFILSVVKNRSVPVIFSKDEEETAQYIRLLTNKKSSFLSSLRPSMKFKTKEDRMRYILEGFPGIGPATSTKLIKKFKSIKNIVNATESDLDEVLNNKAKDFLNLIN